MAAGLVLGAAFASAGPVALLMALPALAGLLLAVPVAVLTARPDAGRRRDGSLPAGRHQGVAFGGGKPPGPP
jgi:membrane glycosyltransferase